MSIDLEVIPQEKSDLLWQDILSTWRSFPDQDLLAFIGNTPKVIRVSDKKEITHDLPMEENTLYTFELAYDHTIGIERSRNTLLGFDERLWINEVGPNLDEVTQVRYSNNWRKIGYHYSFISNIGRSNFELQALKYLLCAVAKLCKGIVVLSNSRIYDLEIGMYLPEEFVKARPNRGNIV